MQIIWREVTLEVIHTGWLNVDEQSNNCNTEMLWSSRWKDQGDLRAWNTNKYLQIGWNNCVLCESLVPNDKCERGRFLTKQYMDILKLCIIRGVVRIKLADGSRDTEHYGWCHWSSAPLKDSLWFCQIKLHVDMHQIYCLSFMWRVHKQQ